MSPFAIVVLTEKNGKSIDELLEPYNENLEVTPYITHYKNKAEEYIDDLIQRTKTRIANNNIPDLQEKLKHLELIKATKNNEIIWKEVCESNYLENFDEKGNAISTYNLNSKWDWYVIGSRYDDCFGLGNNQFLVKDLLEVVIKNKDYCLAVVTPDGKWYEKRKVGWWGTISNKKNEDDWYNEFVNILAEYNRKDIEATIVGCHI